MVPAASARVAVTKCQFPSLYVVPPDMMVMSGLPMPRLTDPPLIRAVPQSVVPPQTSASTRAVPPYHCVELGAVIEVLNQKPIVKSSLRAVTNVPGSVPVEVPAVNAVALLLLAKRLAAPEVEVSVPS